jgi:hypothetical protein
MERLMRKMNKWLFADFDELIDFDYKNEEEHDDTNTD